MRQIKRLQWVLLIAGLVLILNILATIGGLTTPLYTKFLPGAANAVYSAHGASTSTASLQVRTGLQQAAGV